jgi:outer membrane protein TolC
VAQAERALELAELRFRTGLSTQLDISNARLLLQQARVNEAQALYQLRQRTGAARAGLGRRDPAGRTRLLLENN